MEKADWKKIRLILLVVLLNSVGYKAAQFFRPEGFIIMTRLDSFVPFISYFVIPYALYPLVVSLPFYLYWKDYKKYKTMALSVAAVLLISVMIYFASQTQVTRAEVQPQNVFDDLVLFVYSLDNPVNALPSLHVSLPTLATLFIFLRNRKLGFYITPVTILIILSTIFIKQHAVLDVFAGLFLAFAVFRIRHVFDKVKI
ncbi:MAG: phosphatase PAP2 family protein [Candidatus Aenigmarchaeota archaeon]|nr:phosphatase PAP2 family protein [Candidatus Aenigmarchaeota archaeon]